MSTLTGHHGYKADAGGFANGALQVSQSPWSEFFGEPRFQGSHPDYDPQHKDTWTLPDAFAGNSVKLRQETEFLVYSDQNFYTARVMPMRLVPNSNKVSWYKTEYATHRPTLVPELGASRILDSRKSGRSATFERRGLGFMMEHGFMHTEEGRQHYLNTLRQLALSIIEFAKFDVIWTLLTAWNLSAQSERKRDHYRNRRVAELFADQIWMWACLQKQKNAIVKLDTRVSNAMARYRGRADTWIMAPEVQAYLTTTPSEKTDYYLAGPAGPAMLQDTPNAALRVGNKDVFFARTYDIDADGPADIMSAHAQIGEYAEMRDRERDTNYAGYTSKNRHVRIYDEDNDAWFECKLAWALDACLRFDAAGELVDAADVGGFSAALGDARRAGEEDVFAFRDADTGRMLPTRLFGQMEERYFPAADKLNLARTALASVRARWGADNGRTFDKAWQDGLALVDRIDDLGLEDEGALEANATAQALFGLEPGEQGKAAKAVSAAGGLSAGLQSYAGLQAIAAADSKAGDSDKAAAGEFVRAIDSLVSALRDIFPGSYVLDPRFASDWWTERGRKASAGDVFFENVVARSRVPLFTTKATLADADTGVISDEAYATVYGAQRAAVGVRRDKNSAEGAAAAGVDPLPRDLAGVAKGAARDLAITAATLLGAVSSTTDPATNLTLYNQVAEELRRLVGVGAGADNVTLDFTSQRVSRAKLVESVLALGAPFRKPELVQTKIERIFSTQLVQEPGEKRALRQSVAPRRTMLLAGPRVVRELAERAAAGKPLPLLPASPADPSVPISLGELKRMAARFGRGGDDSMADEYATADAPAANAVPAFEGLIASELSPHIEHLTMLRAGAGANGDALMGDEYEGGGGGGGGGGGRRDAYMGDEADDYEAGVPAAPRARRAVGRRSNSDLEEARTAPMRRAWREVRRAAGGDRLLAAVAHAFDMTPIRKLVLQRMIQKDVVLPLAFIVARPHASYNMCSAICCLSGEQMGIYMHQPGAFEVTDDAIVQAHHASYTYKSKAVCLAEDHVFVARNVFANGVLGGLGSILFDPATYAVGSQHTGRESVIVLAVPYASNEANGAPIDLRGQVVVNGRAFNLQQREKLDYVGVGFYNSIWGWRQASQANWSEVPTSLDSVAERVNENTTLFRGLTLLYSPVTRDFTIKQEGNGHWADGTTYVGCKKVRNGEMAEFDRVRGRFEGFGEA